MWTVLKCGKERVLIDLRDILSLLSRGDRATDLYTPLFPEGITVDHPFDDIVATMDEMLSADAEAEEEDDGDEV